MSESASIQRHPGHSVKAAPTEALLSKGHEWKVGEITLPHMQQTHQVAGSFAEPRIEFDFSRVPAVAGFARQIRPMLRIRPMVQRFPIDNHMSPSPCPTCPEAATEESSETKVPQNESHTHGPEASPTPTTQRSTMEAVERTATSGKSESPRLIVEDSATELAPGQMKRSVFLSQLRAEVSRTIEASLSGTDRTAEDCPYLNYWFEYYSRQDSRHIENAVRRYAPKSSIASTAEEYISIIAQRARQATETWVRTGEITGVPEGVPTTLPGETFVESGKDASARTGPVMFKAREGGTRNVDTAQAIRRELGEGSPFSGSARSRMEHAFGMDFSHVRTHTDATAARLSNRLNARAFTVGRHVAFEAGAYRPGTIIGDALIAHELAHVAQQGGSYDTMAPSQKKDARYTALESDADTSALNVMVSLWGQTKKNIVELSRIPGPRLKSGLRLSRCSREESGKESQSGKKEAAKRQEPAPAPEKKPETPSASGGASTTENCNPTPKAFDEIGKIPGVSAGTAGYTKPAPIKFGLDIKPENGKCKVDLTEEAKLNFQHFVYTRPGTYKVGQVKIPFAPCKDRIGDFYYGFTQKMSDKVKAGEIEHCKDFHRAFALSYARYNAAAKQVAAEDIAGNDVPTCQTATMKRLKAITGIEVPQWKTVADCLLDKTLERDKVWHRIDAKDYSKGSFELAQDCSKLTFKFDHEKQLMEIGKHPPDEVVKGCGE